MCEETGKARKGSNGRLFKNPPEKVLFKSKLSMMCKILPCVKIYIDFFLCLYRDCS